MNLADLPTFAAQWWPVMLQTVPGSGEALTIAVIVRAESGQTTVRQAILPPQLATMFGSAGKGMMFLVGHTVQQIRKQLDAGVPAPELEMPFGNIALGRMRDGVARDINEVFGVALRMSSAFAVSGFGHQEEQPDTEARRAFDEWAEKVQAAALYAEHREGLNTAFNVAVPLAHRKKARVGFVFGGYVAQFGVLRPGRTVSADLRALKLKLFDLDVIRREKALQFQRAELLVGVQNPGDAYTSRQHESLKASWEFVADEARARSVEPMKFDSATQAAEHLRRLAA